MRMAANATPLDFNGRILTYRARQVNQEYSVNRAKSSGTFSALMRFRKAPTLISLILLLYAALLCPAAAPGQKPSALQPWSRSMSQTSDGFYFQPEVVGEDYPSATSDQVLKDVAIARRVGARALRFGVSWLDTEPQPQSYDWSKLDTIINTAFQQHLPVIPYICYTPNWAASNRDDPDYWGQPPRDPQVFVRFVRAAVSRYKGKVLAWGLWNEPDNVYWKGTPHQLGEMITSAAQAVRESDPAAGVWMGGLAQGADDFFRIIESSDHVDRAVDAIGLHGYPGTWDARTPDQYYSAQLRAMRQLITTDEGSADLWVDENGYANYRYSDRSASRDVNIPVVFAYEHSAEFQAVMLWRDHVEVVASGIASLMGWYRLHDLPPTTNVIGDDNNRFLGLVDVKGREKPSFRALHFYDQLFNEPTRSLDEKVEIQSHGPDNHAVVHAIEKKNGDVVVSGWLDNPNPNEVTAHGGLAKDARHIVVDLKFPPNYRFTRIRRYKVTGERISQQKLAPAGPGFILKNLELKGNSAAVLVLSR